MTNKYRKNCLTCQKVKKDPKLRTRLYNAFYNRDTLDESITSISKEMGVSAMSVSRHMNRHTVERRDRTPAVVEGHIERMKATIAKETELALDHDALVPKEDYERVIDGVLAEGMDQMKKHGKTITISQLLTAAKIKADYQAKKRGQDIEVIKSMYKFSSGYKSGSAPQAAKSTD